MAETVKGIWLCRRWLQALGCFIGFLYRLQHWGHILWPEVMRGVTCSDPRQVALFPSVLGSITSHTIPEWALVQLTNSHPHLSPWYTEIRNWVYDLRCVYQTQLQCAEKLDLWNAGKPRNEWTGKSVFFFIVCEWFFSLVSKQTKQFKLLNTFKLNALLYISLYIYTLCEIMLN